MRYGIVLSILVALYATQVRAEPGDSWTVALAGIIAGEALCEEKLPDNVRQQVMLRSWAERSDTEATLRTIRMISVTIVDRGRSDEKFRAKFCSTYLDLSADLVSGALR